MRRMVSPFYIVNLFAMATIYRHKILAPWIIKADKIDPENYYGITVANGMIGIVSSPEPFKVKNVVLAVLMICMAGAG
jgi:hypothetical protein